jgi:hypothetical protein
MSVTGFFPYLLGRSRAGHLRLVGVLCGIERCLPTSKVEIGSR